jgi:5-bromo-4-chloroindolyl phosphate hydrolysis protein
MHTKEKKKDDMTKDEIKSFLDQFRLAKEEIKTWPKWMQDAARIASAHFIKSQKDPVDHR